VSGRIPSLDRLKSLAGGGWCWRTSDEPAGLVVNASRGAPEVEIAMASEPI
jgi:hypothetical protein